MKAKNLEDQSDEDLLVYCGKDNVICSERLFQTRVEKNYPHLIPSQGKEEKSWKQLFLEIMYYKNLLNEEFNISHETLEINKTNYEELYRLLYSLKKTETLPKEAILQILLNIEPRYLSEVCKLNRKIQQVCNSDLFKELHKKKYYRFGITLKEENYITPDYMENKIQTQMTPKSRAILLDWIYELSMQEEFHLNSDDVYHYAVRLFDMFLGYCSYDLQKNNFQSLAAVCFNKALEIKEMRQKPVSRYVFLGDGGIKKEDFERISGELDNLIISKNLKKMPTVMDYFRSLWVKIYRGFYREHSPLLIVKSHCYYSLYIKSLDYKFVKYFPSDIVLSTVKENLKGFLSDYVGSYRNVKKTVLLLFGNPEDLKYIGTKEEKDEIRAVLNDLEKYNENKELPIEVNPYVDTDDAYDLYITLNIRNV